MMKVNAYTPQMLLAISPKNIRMYLMSCGWVRERGESAYDVFDNPHIGEPIIVPNDVALGDYVRRVDDVVSDLSRLYSESPQTILMGLTMSSHPNILEYRYDPRSADVGLIGTEDLLKLLQTGKVLNDRAYRDMMRFGTCENSESEDGAVPNDIRIGPISFCDSSVQFLYPSDAGAYSVCDKVESSLYAIADAAEHGKTSLDPELGISHDFVETVMDLEMKNADISVVRTSYHGERHKKIRFSEKLFRDISKIETDMI